MNREKLSKLTTRISSLISSELTQPSTPDILLQRINQLTSVPEIRAQITRLVQQTKLQQQLAADGYFTFNHTQVVDGLIHVIHLAHDQRSSRVDLPPMVTENCSYLITRPAQVLGRKLANL